MSESVIGRYCDSCQKEVQDFTRLSQPEIQDWFRQHQNEKTCGRFLPEQLSAPDPGKQSIWNSIIKTNVIFVSLLAISTALKASPIVSKKVPAGFIEMTGQKKSRYVTAESQFPSDSTRTISGIVVDEAEPLVGVSLKIKGTDLQAITDKNGEFKFNNFDPGSSDKLTLTVTYIGYEHSEQTINLKSDKPIRINMKQFASLMGEVCIVRPTLFKRFLGLFKN